MLGAIRRRGVFLAIAALSSPLLFGADAASSAAALGRWVAAAASFDVSRLDASERLAGDLVARTLARGLFAVERRRLPADEREARGRRLAETSLSAAAAAAASKHAARDALLFAGNEEWKYRSLLEKAEAALAEARKEFDRVSAERPDVPPEAAVEPAAENDAGALIEAPERGRERAFCLKRSYDALLLGSVEPLYGRLLVTVRLYSPYLDRDLYADRAAFSSAGRDEALGELSLRLAAAASGSPPAILTIAAEPEDADLFLDGVLVGQGRAGPFERAPGPCAVAAEREGRERFEDRLELAAGERVDLAVSLPPLPAGRVSVETLDASGPAPARIRHDGLYRGESPLEFFVPEGRSSYLYAETEGRRSASAVLTGDASGTLVLQLVEQPPKDATPTEDARRAFYGAFGRFSATMPFAFIVTGIASSYALAAVYENSAVLGDRTAGFRTASAVLWSVSGAFLVESVVRFVRYLRSSDARAVKRAEVR